MFSRYPSTALAICSVAVIVKHSISTVKKGHYAFSDFVGPYLALNGLSACLCSDAAYTQRSLKIIEGFQVQEVDKKTEFRSFLMLVVFLAPALSIAIVGGYGFIIWISQIILGPPG